MVLFISGVILAGYAFGTMPVRGRRYPEQWIATVAVLWLGGALIRDFAVSKQLGWADVGHYLLSGAILHGVLVTIEYGVISQIIATVIGFLLAAMQQSDNPLLTRIAWL